MTDFDLFVDKKSKHINNEITLLNHELTLV